jgi:phospholipid/cholesterol/gamma-HCH transport system permease protein
VLPRVAALVLMMPLITLYSDLLGVLGAFITCLPMLNIPAMEFWTKLESVVQLKDLEVGIAKGAVFGLLIALAGTMCGLQSERSAAGVSRAVTSAVVIGIVAVVLADALAAPILRDLNL